MSDRLAEFSCVPCRGGEPALNSHEISELLPEIPDWQVNEEQGIPKLIRVFLFKNFNQALAFTQKVGEIAEVEDHHPAILTEWGKVTVSWWTHKIKGLHRNDFVMAAKTDQLLKSITE